jgi:hypothetical protein
VKPLIHFKKNTRAMNTDSTALLNVMLQDIPSLDLQQLSEMIGVALGQWPSDLMSKQQQQQPSPIIILNWPIQQGETIMSQDIYPQNNQYHFVEPTSNQTKSNLNKRRHSQLSIDTLVTKRFKGNSQVNTNTDVLDLLKTPPSKKSELNFDDMFSHGHFLDEVDLLGQFGNILESSSESVAREDHLLVHDEINMQTTPTEVTPCVSSISAPNPTQTVPVVSSQVHVETVQEEKKEEQVVSKSKRRNRRKTSLETTPSTPASDTERRKLVCMGKRPRKNKKTQPEDQFMLKFSMRRSN